MPIVSGLLHWLVYGDALAQAVLCVAVLLLVRDGLAMRYRLRNVAASDIYPPISILKPVHGMEPAAETAFRSWCTQEYPAAYELLFIFEDLSQPLFPLAQSLAEEFPTLVHCLRSGPAVNPLVNGKSHNLAAGAAVARFDWLLISDSDTVADPGTLSRLAAPLADPRVRAVAATPRITLAQGVPARLERLLMNVVMAPFEYAAAQVRGPHGLWGTLLLVHRGVVDRASGFTALGQHLTEDIALEHALHQQGYRGALVHRPVDVQCAALSARQLVQHWHRWMVGLRTMQAGNWAGIGVILLSLLLPPVALASLILRPGAAMERLAAVAVFVTASILSTLLVGRSGIGVREPPSSYLLLPLAAGTLLLAFLRSIVDTTVVWRGRRLNVGRGGGLTMQVDTRGRDEPSARNRRV